MNEAAKEDRMAVVLARIERLKTSLEENAPYILLEEAYKEIGFTLEALAHARRASEDELPSTL